VDVNASDDLEQVRELRPQRQVRLEVLNVDVDLVDFDFADVDKDVGFVRRLASFELFAA